MEIAGTGAIVFGGGSGLGAATGRRLAAGGAHVFIIDLDTGAASKVASSIGGTAIAADVIDSNGVEEAVAAAANAPGGLRICVNCAGIATPAKLLGRGGPTPLESFAKVLAVNLLGTINVVRLAAAAMAENEIDDGGERGLSVNTASVAAFDGQVGQIAYASSKGGVASLTLPAARELADKAVRVMTIAPGIFATPMLAGLPQPVQNSLAASIPFPSRLGDPDEYAELVAHIAANSMLSGEVIRLAGALRMAAR